MSENNKPEVEHKEFYSTIGKKIKAIRILHGYTQEELSQKLGVSRTHLANMECGREKIFFHLIKNLALVFNMSFVQFARLISRDK